LVLVHFVNIIFSGYSIGKLLCGLVTLILYSFAYHGALRRNTCLLRFYYLLHIVGFIVVVALSIFAVAFFFQWKAGICDTAPDGSQLYLNYNDQQQVAAQPQPTPMSGSDDLIAYNPTPAPPPQSMSSNENYVEYCWQDTISNATCSGQLLGTCVAGDFQMVQTEYHGPQQFNVWSILFMVSQLIILFYKIYSVILAFKLRKLIQKAKAEETQLEENTNSIPMSEYPETQEYFPVPTEMSQYPPQFYPQTPIYMPAQSANNANMMTFSMYPQMVPVAQAPAPIAPPKPQ